MNYINPDAPAAGLTRLLNMRDNNPAMQLAYMPTKDIAAMGRMGGLEFNPYSGIPQARGVAAVAEGGSIDEAPLSPMADQLASRGRYGDSMLLHVRPDELQGLASLGTLTINPDTGLPEAFSFKSLAPVIGGIAGSIILPGIGGPLFSGALGVGLGAGLGSFAGGLIAGQKPGQAALGGLISGATAGFMQGLTPDLVPTEAVTMGADSAGVSQLATEGAGSFAVDGVKMANVPFAGQPGIESVVQSSGVGNLTPFETIGANIQPNIPIAQQLPGGAAQTFQTASGKAIKEGLLGLRPALPATGITPQQALDAGFITPDITLAQRASQVLTDPKTLIGAGAGAMLTPPPAPEFQEPEPLEFGPSYVPRKRTLAGGQQRDPETTEQILARMISGGDSQPLASQFRYISEGGLVALQEGGIPTQGQPVVGSTVLEEQEKEISERARQDEIKERDRAMSRGQQFIQQPTGNEQLFQQMQIAGEAIGQQIAQGQQAYATPYGQKAPTASFNTGADFGFNTGGLVGLEEGGKLAPRPRENPINVINNLPQEELYKRMVVREAGNQGLLGMALVARSIDNRFKTLNQSDKIKPSLFGAKDKTIRGILLGDKQYSPVKDFSAARELTDSEEAAAMEAISLSKDVGGLSNLLQEKGYDEDQIFKLLNSTGFRRYDAEYDKSQEVNTEGFGEHIFNMAGNPKGKYKNIEEVKVKPKFEDVPFNKAFPSVINPSSMTDEQYQKLFDRLNTMTTRRAEGGGIGGYFEGQVQGRGDGMSDQILFEVEGNNPDKALLSRDEYVIPADVVAMLGNGSSNAGSDQLDNFIKGVRQDSFGTQKQQRELNAQQGLRGLV